MIWRKSSCLIVLLTLLIAGLSALAAIRQVDPTIPNATGEPNRASDDLPDTISDETFWRMVLDFSEEDSSFRAQLTSNEIGSQFVIPELKRKTKPGGAYLGVGPEQNFTYIAALEPKVAFVIDIRRENMLELLIYKAIFELSTNRVEFVSRLFSRKQPQNPGIAATAKDLFHEYGSLPLEPQLLDQNLKAIRANLVEDHHFGLTNADLAEINTLYKSLCDLGPGIWDGGINSKAIYGNLMTDTDKLGQEQSYLSSENKYQTVRTMERRNLIVPLVGDFAGNKSLRAVGQYLLDHRTTVSAFYVSNVEDYLFTPNSDGWQRFYRNVRTLPLDSSSIFIRSEGTLTVARLDGLQLPQRPPGQPGGTEFISLLSP